MYTTVVITTILRKRFILTNILKFPLKRGVLVEFQAVQDLSTNMKHIYLFHVCRIGAWGLALGA